MALPVTQTIIEIIVQNFHFSLPFEKKTRLDCVTALCILLMKLRYHGMQQLETDLIGSLWSILQQQHACVMRLRWLAYKTFVTWAVAPDTMISPGVWECHIKILAYWWAQVPTQDQEQTKHSFGGIYSVTPGPPFTNID